MSLSNDTGEASGRDAEEKRRKPAVKREPRRSTRVEISGWINLDKPIGMTSTQAVGELKFLLNAKKAGHAGTLDPLASGVLPVAFGEATKTVPVVQDGAKAYRFTVKWGEETDTDDAEGRVIVASEARPSPAEIAAVLPRFVGVIVQTPPMYSAIKIAGERAYDLARDGADFEIAAREIVVHRLDARRRRTRQRDLRGRMRQGRLCARHRARPRPRARLRRPCRRAQARPRRAVPCRPKRRVANARGLARSARRGAALGRGRPCGTDAHRRRSQRRLDSAPRPKAACCAARRRPGEGPAYSVCLGTPVSVGNVEAGYFVSTRVFNLGG